jgi:uncharacterized protein
MSEFTITSREGLPIRGNFEVPKKDARALVVIVHGFKGFKDWGFFPWLAEHLCSHRIAACRFNMSRSGIGEDPETFERLDLFADDTYSTQLDDLADVVGHARSRFPRLPLFLLGHSRGGAVALLASRTIAGIRGVVTWSAIARADRWDSETKKAWRRDGHMDVVNARTKQTMRMSPRILDDYESNASRLNVLESASQIDVPLLVVHGGNDESVPVAEASEISSRAGDASLLIVESATHTYNAIHPLINVPKELVCAAEVTATFIAAYAR